MKTYNAVPLSDDADAVLDHSRFVAMHQGVGLLAAIGACAVLGYNPGIMGVRPVQARCRSRQPNCVDNLRVVEMNEAITAQVSIYCHDLDHNLQRMLERV